MLPFSLTTIVLCWVLATEIKVIFAKTYVFKTACCYRSYFFLLFWFLNNLVLVKRLCCFLLSLFCFNWVLGLGSLIRWGSLFRIWSGWRYQISLCCCILGRLASYRLVCWPGFWTTSNKLVWVHFLILINIVFRAIIVEWTVLIFIFNLVVALHKVIVFIYFFIFFVFLIGLRNWFIVVVFLNFVHLLVVHIVYNNSIRMMRLLVYLVV